MNAHLPTLGRRRKRRRAFTIIEVAVAIVLVSVFFAGAFYSNSRGLTMLRSSKETLAASKTLQERIERLRGASWTEVTDADTLRGIYAIAPSTNSLGSLAEKVTISPWPPVAGNSLVVTRSSAGAAAISSDNDTLVDGNAVLVTIQVTWVGAGSRPRLRETATVIANGGLGR